MFTIYIYMFFYSMLFLFLLVPFFSFFFLLYFTNCYFIYSALVIACAFSPSNLAT